MPSDPMTLSRAELDTMLDRLEARLPDIVRINPDDGDFWAEFAGEADAIEDAAGAEDCEHVARRIDAMLATAGLGCEG